MAIGRNLAEASLMKKLLSVFTEKYPQICRKIINNAVIDINGIALPVKAQWDTL